MAMNKTHFFLILIFAFRFSFTWGTEIDANFDFAAERNQFKYARSDVCRGQTQRYASQEVWTISFR